MSQKFSRDVLRRGETAVVLHNLAEVYTTLTQLNLKSLTQTVEVG